MQSFVCAGGLTVLLGLALALDTDSRNGSLTIVGVTSAVSLGKASALSFNQLTTLVLRYGLSLSKCTTLGFDLFCVYGIPHH